MYNFLQKLLNQQTLIGAPKTPSGGDAKFEGLSVLEPSGIHSSSVLSNVCWIVIMYFLLQFTAVVCTPIWMKTNGMTFARTVLQQLITTWSRALPVAAAVAAGGGGAGDIIQQILTPPTLPHTTPPGGAATLVAAEAVRRKRPVFQREYHMGMAGVADLAARVDKAIEKAGKQRW